MSLLAQTDSPCIDDLSPECQEQIEILAMQLGMTQDEAIEYAVREFWTERMGIPPCSLA